LDILLCVFWRRGELLEHSPIRILKERRVTWSFSYAYFEWKESYLDILLYVFWTKGELLGHSPICILNERRVTWSFSYTYFEGKKSYLEILLYVFWRKGSFKIRIGECPSNFPFVQNTYRRMSK
jgi:hypothetical protein